MGYYFRCKVYERKTLYRENLMNYTTVKLRTDLHRKLRHYTIDADKTVQVVVEKAIEDFLATHGPQRDDQAA